MIEIELTQGQVALIDDSDFELVSGYSWRADRRHRTFYALTTIRLTGGKRTPLYMHRLILDAPPYLETDHIDHNGLNNQRANLRLCTTSQNQMNGKGRGTRCSPYKGVCLHKGRWQTSIEKDGKNRYVGRFDSPEEAARAYDAKARELFGDFARLNFPDE